MALSKKMILLIAALVVSLIEITISLVPKLKTFDLKGFLDTVMLVVTIIGIITQSNKEKNQKNEAAAMKPVYKLTFSFESGLYGGIVGGILSGAAIAMLEYLMPKAPPLLICLKIIPLCAAIGCLFGVSIYLGRMLFAGISSINDYWSEFLGCLCGCLIAGTFSGMLGMFMFGRERYDFDYAVVVLASVIGTLGLVFGSLIYEYEGKIKYIIFSLTIALVLSAFIPLIGFLLINDETIRYYQKDLSDAFTGTNEYLIETGAILGVINGFIFGLVIGLTLVFYKYWKFAEKQRLKESNQIKL